MCHDKGRGYSLVDGAVPKGEPTQGEGMDMVVELYATGWLRGMRGGRFDKEITTFGSYD
jgi:hypothetical protein